MSDYYSSFFSRKSKAKKIKLETPVKKEVMKKETPVKQERVKIEQKVSAKKAVSCTDNSQPNLEGKASFQ